MVSLKQTLKEGLTEDTTKYKFKICFTDTATKAVE